MKKLQLALAGLAAATTLSLTTIAPASADSAASTRNIILGVAAIAGIAIESNVARKNAQAGTISGYLSDGSAVYGDGHVVARNGYSYYPGNNGQNVSCANGRCSVAFNTNSNGANSGWNNANTGYRNDGYRNDGRNNGYRNNGNNANYGNNGYDSNDRNDRNDRTPYRDGDNH